MNLMSLKTIRITLMFSLPILVSCGGGGGESGGGGGSGSDTATTISTSFLSFQPLIGGGTNAAIIDVFSKDLNGDGIDEVIVVGRKSQPATDENWQNFNMRVYGWNNSTALADETDTWMPGGINVIVGSEPSVEFGDFDGDGDMDMFIAATTDMYDPDGADNIAGNADDQTLRGDSLVFVNNGAGVFSKTTVESNATWSHASVMHDFTGDGNPDIMVSDYQSNGRIFYYDTSTTTWKKLTFYNSVMSGSGIAVGDFVTGGNKELVITDSIISGSSNSRNLLSYSVDLVGGTFVLALVGDTNTLPADDYTNYGHTIRVLTMDFDGDADDDIIAFERKLSSNFGGRIQFMQNNGDSTFTDVTGTFLTGYNGNNGSVGYQPVIMDANGDGFNDIFISGGDDTTVDQTTILMNNGSNSLYTASYTSNFAAEWTANNNVVTADYYTSNRGQNQHIVLGPSSNYFLITLVDHQQNANVTYGVFAKNLGTNISTGL